MINESTLKRRDISGILTAGAALLALIWAVGGSVVNWTRSDTSKDGQFQTEIAVLQDEMKSKADAGVLQVEVQTLQTEVKAADEQNKAIGAQLDQLSKTVLILQNYARRSR